MSAAFGGSRHPDTLARFEALGLTWPEWLSLTYAQRNEIDPEHWPMPPAAKNETAEAIKAVVVTGPLRAEVNVRSHEATSWIAQVAALPLDTPAQEAEATEIMDAIRDEWKALDERRTTITGPLNTALRAVNELFRPALSSLKAAETSIKSRLSARATEKENANREARERAFAAAAVGNTEAVGLALAAVQDETPPPGIRFREVWVFEETDRRQIPIEFLMVNAEAVEGYVKTCEAMGRDPSIGGLRFFPKKIPVAGRR